MTTGDLEHYYNQGREQGRLSQGVGRVELARTQEIILRYLPPPPETVMDIGGAAGVYALWLAQRGYAVHLVDLMPLHIEQALAASAAQPDYQLASATVGTATQLAFEDDSADAVLLMGPLYHLTERADRLQSLREAHRILKPGGLLFAATISRYASLFEGVMRAYLLRPGYPELVGNALAGVHHNPERESGLFTTAYFHTPDATHEEIAEAGFTVEALMAVEGPAAFSPNFDALWDNPAARDHLLGFLRQVESEPDILGATGHLLAVARKG